MECRRPPRRPCVNSLSRSWDVSEAKRGRGGGCDNAAFFFQNLRAWRHRVFICRAPPEIQKFGKVCSKGKVQRDSKVSVFSIIFLFVVCSGTSDKDNARRRILGRGKGLKGCIGRYHEPFQVCPSCPNFRSLAPNNTIFHIKRRSTHCGHQIKTLRVPARVDPACGGPWGCF